MKRKAPQSAPHVHLTPDAQNALERAGFSRRAFLQGSGAMIVSFSALGKAFAAGAQLSGSGKTRQAANIEVGKFGAHATPGAPPPDQVDSWIAIGADGRVTAYTGKAEIGQGMETAQIQLVAEELCVGFDRVHLISCQTPITPDEGITSGSQSTPANFNHENLAQAGATAREALLRLGARRLGVPVASVVARDGAIEVRNDAAKKIGYGELLAGKRFDLRLDPDAERKPMSEWTILGTSVQRADLPAVVTGELEYVHNVRLPGMLHGQVVRPPEVGATVIGVDEGSVAGMAGVVKVVVRKNFVGVVARKPWQAIQAAKRLKVHWSPGTGLPPQESYYEYLRHQKSHDSLVVNSRDVPEKLAGAATVLKATYYHPYQMHGSMGTSCAVADVRGDHATIYSATQSVWPMRATVAMVLGLDPKNINVLFRRGPGCYGLNGADTVTYDASVLSQVVGKPVRVQLSRKDEMSWGENYGYPFVMDERAGLDAKGNIVVWDREAWFATLGSRPFYDWPGNVPTGMLLGFEAQPFVPRSPAPEPTRYNNYDNFVPSYCVGRVGAKAEGTGTIESERVLVHNLRSPLFTGPLRSPERLQNTFAEESFMDEIAAHLKADPVALRLRYLSFPRLRDLVTAAARQAGWDARPSPKPHIRRTGVVSGRGIACVPYSATNGYVAMVAEVDVDQDSGRIAVKRFVAAIDVGPISNPNGLKNQVEGGALQGMSRALGEEVTWDERKVTSIDWATYHTLFLGSEVPKVDVVLLNRPNVIATGAGEVGITVVAAAIGNAVFDATGARLREIPFTPERVKAALRLRA